jgi:hypothetical protein
VKVNLFYRAHGKARGTSSISLSVPVEICAWDCFAFNMRNFKTGTCWW